LGKSFAKDVGFSASLLLRQHAIQACPDRKLTWMFEIDPFTAFGARHASGNALDGLDNSAPIRG
jgi:hypothetical protein